MNEDSVLGGDNLPNRTIPKLLCRSKDSGDCNPQEVDGNDLRHRSGRVGVVGTCPYCNKPTLPSIYPFSYCGECSRHVLSVG